MRWTETETVFLYSVGHENNARKLYSLVMSCVTNATLKVGYIFNFFFYIEKVGNEMRYK